MKLISHKTFLIYFILICFTPINGSAQSVNNNYWRPYFWYIGGNTGISQTALPNRCASVITNTDLTKRNSFMVSFEAGYLFSKKFGLSTGLGLNPFFSQLSLNSYSNTLDTVDSENEPYERRIIGKNIKEDQRIYFLEIPVILNFLFPMARTSGFYIQSGLTLSIPIIKRYSSSGIYSFSGFYPAYNVTLTDIPYEGLKSDIDCEVEGNLRIKDINPELVAIGGYYLYPNPRYKISLGIVYKRIFTNISDYQSESPFQLSVLENQIKSLMEGSEKTTASSIGISISLSYFIK